MADESWQAGAAAERPEGAGLSVVGALRVREDGLVDVESGDVRAVPVVLVVDHALDSGSDP